ncbi:sulfite exporter TauE/SafE family protein [Xanthomonadaceae bacterium JHOS43]|nr:sulfite exporter TauE/SafE family protein [Xanthomonadaceae bacterium JHOS43]
MSIDLIALGAALLAGLVGSVHCVAMCGGIATGFAPYGGDAKAAWRVALTTNLGRVAGYALAGAIVGGFGHGLVALFRIEHLMFGLRALAGVVLILVALKMLGATRRFDVFARAGDALWAKLRPLQSRLLPANTFPRRFGLGMLWGWLPCGLSSTMLAAAWLQATPHGGAALMAAFGLGTLPTMLPLSYSGARWLARPGQRRMAGGLMLAAGFVTLAAPWLMHVPALHDALAALGCLPRA